MLRTNDRSSSNNRGDRRPSRRNRKPRNQWRPPVNGDCRDSDEKGGASKPLQGAWAACRGASVVAKQIDLSSMLTRLESEGGTCTPLMLYNFSLHETITAFASLIRQREFEPTIAHILLILRLRECLDSVATDIFTPKEKAQTRRDCYYAAKSYSRLLEQLVDEHVWDEDPKIDGDAKHIQRRLFNFSYFATRQEKHFSILDQVSIESSEQAFEVMREIGLSLHRLGQDEILQLSSVQRQSIVDAMFLCRKQDVLGYLNRRQSTDTFDDTHHEAMLFLQNGLDRLLTDYPHQSSKGMLTRWVNALVDNGYPDLSLWQESDEDAGLYQTPTSMF